MFTATMTQFITPQLESLTEIQMENGKRKHHYDGQWQTTVRT